MKDLNNLKAIFLNGSFTPDDSNNNFYFIKRYDSYLYELLQTNEGMIRLDSVQCAKNLRDTAIYCMRVVFEGDPEAQKIIRENNKAGGFLPYLKAAEKLKKRYEISIKKLDQILQITNTANHYLEDNNKALISYKSLQESFISLHDILKAHYMKTDPLHIDMFSQHKYRSEYQQIGSYTVYHYDTPAHSSFERQYMCFRIENEKKRYYIIRQYVNIEHSDFSGRENEVLETLWQKNPEYPQGIVSYERIDSKPESAHPEDARSFIIYSLNGLPIKLSPSVLSKWDEHTKVSIMSRLANAVANMHKKNIYHRNLNPDSVYIYETEGGTGINVTGFEYSKIINAKGTVISQAQTNYSDDNIFAAPEVRAIRTQKEYDQTAWDMADIFSLGMLFVYIITDGNVGRKQKKNTNIQEVLEEYKCDYPNKLIELIKSMCDNVFAKRPSAARVRINTDYYDSVEDWTEEE